MIKNKLLLSLLFAFTLLVVYVPRTQAHTQVQAENLETKIYPSEIKENHFFIEISEAINITESDVKVINLLGSEIPFTIQKMVNGSFRVDFDNIASGIYIVRITKDRKQSTHRIVVRSN